MKKLCLIMFIMLIATTCFAQSHTAQDVLSRVLMDSDGNPYLSVIAPTEYASLNMVFDSSNNALRVRFADDISTPVTTVAELPSTPTTGVVFVVSDGSDGSDCSVGGGTDVHFCLYDGSSWNASAATELTGAITITGTLDVTGDLTTPKVIGGTATTSDLSLQTTSGVGTTGADMHFLVGNDGATEAMTILNSGNVGIGTTSPGYPLQVSGVAAAYSFTIPSYNSSLHTNTLTLHGSYGAGIQGTYSNPSGGYLTFGHFVNSVFSEKMRLTAAGNVGIGTTTPSQELEVNGDIVADTVTTASTANPAISFKDSDATAGDDNCKIYANGTDTGDGTEDCDLFVQCQVAGALTTFVALDADANTLEMPVPAAAPTPSANSRIIFYLDETGHNLKAAVKYSDGTSKTATIAFD